MCAVRWQSLEKMLLGQQHRWPGIIENGGDSHARICRINRQIRSPGLENGQQGNDRPRRALQENADQGLRTYAQAAQKARQMAGLGM
jgi:hypothetical protein